MPKKTRKIFYFLLKNKKLFLSFLFFVFTTVLILQPMSAAAQIPGIGDFGNALLPSLGAGFGGAPGAIIGGGLGSGSISPSGIASSAISGTFEFVRNISLSLVSFVALAFASITQLIAEFTGAVLSWVMSDGFINVSYTNPGGPNGNPIVKAGLSVTQGLVNMILVVFLVYIAIATMLKLSGYETRKVLVNFIIIALLVNFAPVICGLIVDHFNILMNFFIQGTRDVAWQTFLAGGKSALDTYSPVWIEGQSISNQNITGILENMAQLITLGIVNIMTSLAYGIFTVLFIVRYIAIWILVIFSPIAFAFLAVPFTKGYFKAWINQFLQWSMIGVTAAFFLQLAGVFTNQMGNIIGGSPDSGIKVGTLIFGLITPVIFLIIGIFYALTSAAVGSKAIISIGQRGIKGGAKWATKRTGRGIRPILEKMGSRKVARKMTQIAENIPVGRWFFPEAIKKYGELRPRVEAARKEAEVYSSIANADNVMKGASIGADATGRILETIKRGDSQDLFNAAKRTKWGKNEKGEELSDEEILNHPKFRKIMSDPLKTAKFSGLHSSILRSDPRLASIFAGQEWGYKDIPDTDEGRKKAIEKAAGEARAQHITNWEPEVFGNQTVIKSSLGKFDRNRWIKIADLVKNGQTQSLKGIDEAFSNFVRDESSNLTRLIPKLKDGDKDAHKQAWTKFQQFIKQQTKGGEGYFLALDDKRFRDSGWRTGRYVEGKTQGPGQQPKSKGTPGATTMGQRPQGTPGAGAQRRKPPRKPPKKPKGTLRSGTQKKRRPPKGKRST
tara:strand:- start:1951 stop:4302 length:2352 start_codon:yes stop_codon:yes gene_type:complete